MLTRGSLPKKYPAHRSDHRSLVNTGHTPSHCAPSLKPTMPPSKTATPLNPASTAFVPDPRSCQFQAQTCFDLTSMGPALMNHRLSHHYRPIDRPRQSRFFPSKTAKQIGGYEAYAGVTVQQRCHMAITAQSCHLEPLFGLGSSHTSSPNDWMLPSPLLSISTIANGKAAANASISSESSPEASPLPTPTPSPLRRRKPRAQRGRGHSLLRL